MSPVRLKYPFGYTLALALALAFSETNSWKSSMQSGGTSTTTTLFHVVEGNTPQEPTSLANPAPAARTVIALTVSEAGISVILAKITVPYV